MDLGQLGAAIFDLIRWLVQAQRRHLDLLGTSKPIDCEPVLGRPKTSFLQSAQVTLHGELQWQRSTVELVL